MKKKKWFFWTIIVLILGVAGFLGNNYLQGNSREQTQSSDLKSNYRGSMGKFKEDYFSKWLPPAGEFC